MPDKSGEKLRNGRTSRNANNNSPSDGDEADTDNGMRVGEDYQAQIPDYNPGAVYDGKPEAMLVWAPSSTLPDVKVDEYIRIAKDLHDYNMEQALGMLFWHKHNIEGALSDLPNFTPFPDEWSIEDKVLFEQAFSFHGKRFYQIKKMLPDKSIAALVKFFYTWKGTRSRSSVMDRQAKKLSNGGDSDDGSDNASSSDKDKKQKNQCVNCGAVTSQLHVTAKGSMCHNCYQYWRKSGKMRSAGAKRHDFQSRDCHNPIKNRQKPPKGIYLDLNDLLAMLSGPPNQPEAILKSLDSELVSLKRMVQNNKQILGHQKHNISSGVDIFRPQEPSFRVNARWTNEELLLAVQGVRKYGKDFKAIAEVIGNKTEVQISSFFVNFCHRYNLNEVLEEYEAENGKSERLRCEMTDEADIVNEAEMKIQLNMADSTLSGTANVPHDISTPADNNNILKPSNTAVLKQLQPVTKDSGNVFTLQTCPALSSVSKKLPGQLDVTMLPAPVTRTTPSSVAASVPVTVGGDDKR